MRRDRRINTCILSVIAGWCASRGSAAAQDSGIPSGGWSTLLGAELRERFESSDHPVFGLDAPSHNDYLLHRAVVSAEAAHPSGFRSRVAAIGGFTSGWEGSPPAIQDNPLDVLEAFAEQSFTTAAGTLVLKAGRQPMTLGSSRLVSLRESPNIRRAFDGVRLTWTGSAMIDLFYLRPVTPEDETFDDRSSPEQQFWGLYTTLEVPRAPGLKADLYYLGLRRDDAIFAAGRADEQRDSVGFRLFGDSQSFDWNIEGVWQWGSFGESRIRAWTFSADLGYVLQGLRFSPRLGLKADAISGDRNLADRKLETFNPLFPKLPYYSEANLATPANLLDVQPNLTLTLTPKVTAMLSWDALWKHAKADAFYAPPLDAVPGTANANARPIGTQASFRLEWTPTQDIELGATYVPFTPRSVAQQAGGRSGSFFATWVQARF